MDDIIETITYKDYKIKLSYDPYADNPLDDATPLERNVWFALFKRGSNLPYEISADMNDYTSWTELAKAVTSEVGELPDAKYKFVRWYEHSGVSISLVDDESTGRSWDAGIAGIVFGETPETIESCVNGWADYITGEVYQYNIFDKHGDIIDSCSGLFDYDYTVGYAKNFIDNEYTPPRDSVYALRAGKVHY